MPFHSTNPATGQLFRRHRPHSRAQLEERLALAVRAQQGWRELAPVARARQLRRLGRTLLTHQNHLAALATLEMGKPIQEARAEIEKSASACAYYARYGPALLAPETRPAAPAGSRVVFTPLGVVLAIMPWNFPVWQVIRAAVPALLAGNTVLLKHAPTVTGCALALEQLVREAGLPAGLLQTILAEPPAVATLIKDPRVRGVTLTGSTRAGREVGTLAAAALKPFVCELGGSDAYVVLADAEVDHAAATLATGRLINGGQSCLAAKRLIVVSSVRRAFEKKLVEVFRQRRLGNPSDPATQVGPLARADLRDQLHRQVQQSIRQGARVLLGGEPLHATGFFYAPTVLTDVRPGMPAFDEELFGPVAAIIPARHEQEALTLANQSSYGLGAGIFTRDRARGEELAHHELEAGAVAVNDFVRSDPSLPFGGIKDSGFGRELGLEGLRSFVNIKTILTGRR
jgi:succinate-semialdehyde dehydrogenase / glutarate-semialdehyde dehydrogenase